MTDTANPYQQRLCTQDTQHCGINCLLLAAWPVCMEASTAINHYDTTRCTLSDNVDNCCSTQEGCCCSPHQ
jgi:hypothetical protein